MHDPAQARGVPAWQAAQMGQARLQLGLRGAGEMKERVERALHYIGGVVGLSGQVASLPRESALPWVHVPEACFSEPARQPVLNAGHAPRTVGGLRPALAIDSCEQLGSELCEGRAIYRLGAQGPPAGARHGISQVFLFGALD